MYYEREKYAWELFKKTKQKENILNLITIAPVGAYFIFIFIE